MAPGGAQLASVPIPAVGRLALPVQCVHATFLPLWQLSKPLSQQTPGEGPCPPNKPLGAHPALSLPSLGSREGQEFLKGMAFFFSLLKTGSPYGWKSQSSFLCRGSKATGRRDRNAAVAASGFIFIFLIMCSGVSLHMDMCILKGGRGQVSDPLELELWTLVIHLTWVLGTKLGSSGRADVLLTTPASLFFPLEPECCEAPS